MRKEHGGGHAAAAPATATAPGNAASATTAQEVAGRSATAQRGYRGTNWKFNSASFAYVRTYTHTHTCARCIESHTHTHMRPERANTVSFGTMRGHAARACLRGLKGCLCVRVCVCVYGSYRKSPHTRGVGPVCRAGPRRRTQRCKMCAHLVHQSESIISISR